MKLVSSLSYCPIRRNTDFKRLAYCKYLCKTSASLPKPKLNRFSSHSPSLLLTMAVGGGAISSDDVVIKSPADRRLYRYVELANGLCALLVHDPEIYSDQPYGERKLGGGSEEDDDEDEDEEEDDEDFGEGDSGEEDDVGEEEEKVLKSSLQKKAAAAMCVGMGSFKDPYEAQGLAHFLEHMLFMGSADFPDENEICSIFHFISPLVKAEAMEREVLAVDSGNKKSLADAVEKGINLRDHVLKLYDDYYYGGSMKLVIIGGETLDVLESWVLESFSNIRKGLSVKPEIGLNIPIWKAGKLYRLEAVKDVHILDLSWTLPSLRKDYLKKAEDYLAHLLGHGEISAIVLLQLLPYDD